MEFEDMHYGQEPTLASVRQSLSRMSNNIHQYLIPRWRELFQAGQDPRTNMTAIANGLLGLLAQARDFFAANPSELTIVANYMGKTTQQVSDSLIVRANILIAFRDAPKTTIALTKTAVDTLATSFPTPKTPSPIPLFYTSTPPTTW